MKEIRNMYWGMAAVIGVTLVMWLYLVATVGDLRRELGITKAVLEVQQEIILGTRK